MGWINRSPLPVGIDIGSHSVKLLQLSQRGSDVGIHAAVQAPLELRGATPEAILARAAMAIKPLVASGQFKGTRCVVALHPALVQTRTMRLPPMPEAEVNQAVYWEAKDRFGFDVDAGQLAWLPAGEVRHGTEVRNEYILFAASGETLSQYVKAMEECGLTPAGIDLAPRALVRAAQFRAAAPADAMQALVEVGASTTQIVLFQRQNMVFYKTISVGGDRFTDATAKKLNMSHEEAAALRIRLSPAGQSIADSAAPDGPATDGAALRQAIHDAIRPAAEELARELELCLRYCSVNFRGNRVTSIKLSGGESQCEALASTIAGVLSLPVEAGKFLAASCPAANQYLPQGDSHWALATGLALYGLPLKVQLQEAA